jgi:hypothetical protein
MHSEHLRILRLGQQPVCTVAALFEAVIASVHFAHFAVRGGQRSVPLLDERQSFHPDPRGLQQVCFRVVAVFSLLASAAGFPMGNRVCFVH